MKTYTAEVTSRSKDDLETLALKEAQEYFGHSRLDVATMDVSRSTKGPDVRLSDRGFWKATVVVTEQTNASRQAWFL